MKSVWQSLWQLLHRIRSGSIEFGTKPYRGLLESINGLGSRYRECDGNRLRTASDELRRRAQEGSPPRRLLVEAFALAREAASRQLGMRPYDVQVLAGIVLDHGKVAEMQTGEGKTLAAVLPACKREIMAYFTR